MKKTTILLCFSVILLLSGCAVKKQIPQPTKAEIYKSLYEEKPVTVLIMPPINRTENVEAKDMFHSTLSMPICNAGYYVIPPFLSMEILKQESAYDAELFLDASLSKFGEIFGADLALFTIIHQWKKTAVAGRINVEIEYILKSTKTDSIGFQRKGNITLTPSLGAIPTSPIGLIVVAAALVENTITNAATDNAFVGLLCNNLMLSDLPAGRYSPQNGKDGHLFPGPREFKRTLNGKAKSLVKITTQSYSRYAIEDTSKDNSKNKKAK